MLRPKLNSTIRIGQLWIILMLSIAAASCSTISYLGQSVRGQWEVSSKSRPIDRLLAENSTPQALKQKLLLVKSVREFAQSELRLPAGGSFTRYADLQRDFVLWNVFAAPELSIEPLQWCFPVAGCVAYRGYFDKRRADKFARKLRSQGHDVYVGPVSAYSTLGWFDDPILNTTLRYSELDIVATIFHELAHQRCYIKGDTVFNESFATAVEEEGLRRYYRGESGAARLSRYRIGRREQAALGLMVEQARRELADLYAQPSKDEDKRRLKAAVIERFRQGYYRWLRDAGVSGQYQRWVDESINNAKLNSIALYFDYLPGFRKRLEQVGFDIEKFYREACELRKLTEQQRAARLRNPGQPRRD